MSDSTLEQFLDDPAREALYRPAGKAVGLPGRCYGAGFHELERRKLFPRVWAPIAVGADIPNPGDAMPVELAGWPLIVLRDRAGAVRCFHNVCRHRGMRVLLEPGRVGHALRCPWHAWTYRLDGTLSATPDIGGEGVDEAAGFRREELGLRPVRCGQWLDYVLVNIDGKAPPLAEHMAPIDRLLAGRDLTGLRHGALWEHTYPGNWKIAVEGGIEDLHLPFGHPYLLAGVTKRNARIDTAPGCFAATSYQYEYKAGEEAGGGTRGHMFPPLPATGKGDHGRHFIINVFPHGVIAAFNDHFLLGLMALDGPDRTSLRFHYYFHGAAATDPAHAAKREALVAAWAKVAIEDDKFVRNVDANKHVRDALGIDMRFSPYWEGAVHHFQKMVVEAVSD